MINIFFLNGSPPCLLNQGLSMGMKLDLARLLASTYQGTSWLCLCRAGVIDVGLFLVLYMYFGNSGSCALAANISSTEPSLALRRDF